MRIAHAIHYPILQFAMHHKLAVLGFAACVLVVAFGMIAPNLGSEFVPRLSEGAIAIDVVRLAGTDLESRSATTPRWRRPSWPTFPTRSSTSGAASARPRSPPTRWASS